MSYTSKSSEYGSRTSIDYLRNVIIAFLQCLNRPDFGNNNKASAINFKYCFRALLL